jgi:hypothetical protein
VAEYLDADPSIVRVIWAILAIVTGGIFVVVYIVMWIVVPEGPTAAAAPAAESGASGDATAGVAGQTQDQPADQPANQPAGASVTSAPVPARRRSSGGGSLIFGLILVGLGAYFLIREYVPQIDTDLLWPIGLVVLGIVLVVASLRRPRAE